MPTVSKKEKDCIRASARWWCPSVCQSWGKRSWCSTILQWRSMAHTIVMRFSVLTQQLYCVSCMRSRETSSCRKTVLQHTAQATQSNFLNGRHPRSLHQTCGPQIVDYKILGEMHRRVYQTKVHDLDELRQRLIDVWHQWRNWWMAQTSACMYSCERRTFWAFALIQGHTYDNFSVLSLWILKEKYYYCVKYFGFLIFCISQGSVATRLRCGGKYNNSFVTTFLLSTAVKEFLKSVNIFRSYAWE